MVKRIFGNFFDVIIQFHLEEEKFGNQVYSGTCEAPFLWHYISVGTLQYVKHSFSSVHITFT